MMASTDEALGLVQAALSFSYSKVELNGVLFYESASGVPCCWNWLGRRITLVLGYIYILSS